MLNQLDINSHSTFQVLRWLQETRGFTLVGKNVIAIGSHDFLEHDGFVHYGANQILAFECNPNVIPDLIQRVNNRHHTYLVDTCLWSKYGVMKDFYFFKDKKYGAGSLFKDSKLSTYVPDCKQLQEKVTLFTHTFDDVLETSRTHKWFDFNMNNIGWVSLDVQGSELEVLKGAKTLMAAKPEVFYTEVSWDNLYEGAPLMDEVDTFFFDHNYKKLGVRTDIAVQGDAIYVKT